MTNTNINYDDQPNSSHHVNSNKNYCDRLFLIDYLKCIFCNRLFAINYPYQIGCDRLFVINYLKLIICNSFFCDK